MLLLNLCIQEAGDGPTSVVLIFFEKRRRLEGGGGTLDSSNIFQNFNQASIMTSSSVGVARRIFLLAVGVH